MSDNAPSLFELDARFDAMQAQRNNAMNDAVMLHAQLAVAQKQVETLQAEIERLKAQAPNEQQDLPHVDRPAVE